MVQNIGKLVRELRKNLSLTQEHLAEKAGINIRHVVRIETNKSEPTLDTIKKLANALEISPTLFISLPNLNDKDLIKHQIHHTINQFDAKDLIMLKKILDALVENKKRT